MKRRILFVDGAPSSLRELKGKLVHRCPEWDVQFKSTAVGALDFLAEAPCDALVADLRLMDMPGDQLAGEVMRLYPRMHRLILADLGDLQSLLKCVGTAHQFLTKPCESARLQSVLQRAFDTDVWLPNQTVRELVGRMPKLPSPADSYTRLVQQLQAGSPVLGAVGAWIAQDPALTAKVLQLANSAAYGPPLDEADPLSAVEEIGLENTRALVLLSHSYSSFRDLDGSGFSVSTLWRDSQRTSRFARWIAETEDPGGASVTQSATAGLLYDIGKLALAANLPVLYRKVLKLVDEKKALNWEAEQEVFGATHGEVGGCLLAIWGLPVPVVEAVALHRHPARFLSSSFNPLTAVHAASAFVSARSLAEAEGSLDHPYLRELGLENRIERWWEACRTREETRPQPAAAPARS